MPIHMAYSLAQRHRFYTIAYLVRQGQVEEMHTILRVQGTLRWEELLLGFIDATCKKLA